MKKKLFHILSITALLMACTFQAHAAEPQDGFNFQVHDAFQKANTIFTITDITTHFVYYTIQLPHGQKPSLHDIIPGTVLAASNMNQLEGPKHAITRWCLQQTIQSGTIHRCK